MNLPHDECTTEPCILDIRQAYHEKQVHVLYSCWLGTSLQRSYSVTQARGSCALRTGLCAILAYSAATLSLWVS